MIKALFLFIIFSLTGCATISSDYTPPPLDVKNTSGIGAIDDVSFSVELISEIGRFRVIDKEDMVTLIMEKLRGTGLYKKVVYAPISKRSDKHLHFQFVISGTKENEAMAYGYLSGLTLMTIPVSLDYYSDMAVFMIESNAEVFSASASEKINQNLWLPLIILSPFFNDYVTGNRVLKKQVNYLISEIAENQRVVRSNP